MLVGLTIAGVGLYFLDRGASRFDGYCGLHFYFVLALILNDNTFSLN